MALGSMRLGAAASVMRASRPEPSRLEHREEVVQRFGQRSMGIHRFAWLIIRHISDHGKLQESHHLAALDPEDGGAQDGAGAGSTRVPLKPSPIRPWGSMNTA